MTFGQIKSIIEKNLVESYKDSSTFKQTLKEFKHNVLNNKSFSKVYSIYDDLNIPQGLSENDAKEFLEESVNVIRHLLENTSLPKNGEKAANIYQNIDNLVYFENVNIHERLSSKKMLIDNLMLTTKGLNESPKIPLKSMVSIANQTIGKYIESLDEATKKEVFYILASKNEDLEIEYTTLKESTINKLKVLLNKQEESDIQSKINETIERIEIEKFDQVNYVKLKRLEESIVLDS
jgi:restriction endonuclease Mrr